MKSQQSLEEKNLISAFVPACRVARHGLEGLMSTKGSRSSEMRHEYEILCGLEIIIWPFWSSKMWGLDICRNMPQQHAADSMAGGSARGLHPFMFCCEGSCLRPFVDAN